MYVSDSAEGAAVAELKQIIASSYASAQPH